MSREARPAEGRPGDYSGLRAGIDPDQAERCGTSLWLDPDRHPSYRGLRDDKPAEQVVREKKKRLNPKAAGPIKFVG